MFALRTSEKWWCFDIRTVNETKELGMFTTSAVANCELETKATHVLDFIIVLCTGDITDSVNARAVCEFINRIFLIMSA